MNREHLKALQFYADPTNHKVEGCSNIDMDGGKMAREALMEHEEIIYHVDSGSDGQFYRARFKGDKTKQGRAAQANLSFNNGSEDMNVASLYLVDDGVDIRIHNKTIHLDYGEIEDMRVILDYYACYMPGGCRSDIRRFIELDPTP